jgi:nucleoside-diphosphate-sugar epimerase
MNPMTTALIGCTGFVGGNLLRQASFDDLYHSRNIETIAGRSYDLLVCAGAPAQKWLANREPAADRAALGRLMNALDQVRVSFMILISTVDVLPVPVGVDEDAPIDPTHQQPYGKHRHELERFVASRFRMLVVRLPGLFGPGLKKNIIYDFLHDNEVSKIHPRSTFQFYDLANLWRDIEIARRHELKLIHFATEPVSVQEVAAGAFGRDFRNDPGTPPATYDFRSKYASLYGGANGYLYSRTQVMDALIRFVQAERRKHHEISDLQSGLVA